MDFAKPHLLHLAHALPPGLPYHFARTEVNSLGPYNPHRHDFYEIFLIEAGRGTHHLRSSKQSLTPGHLGFICPDHVHTFSGDHLLVANLSFEPKWVFGIAARHFQNKISFFGAPGKPTVVRLDEAARQRVSQIFDLLVHPPLPSLALEQVLLSLITYARRLPGGSPGPGPKIIPRPFWLETLVGKLAQPEVLRGETTTWVATSGYHPAHVARTVRRHFAVTPTDLMNRARLKLAAELLGRGNREVLEIALDSGFKNLSHFYECFKKEYGHSPRHHRFLARQVVGGMAIPRA